MNNLSQKRERIEHANTLIKIISEHGRRFFYDKKNDRIAHFVMLGGLIYFMDDYSGKNVSVNRRAAWNGFSHGGTLRELVLAMAIYIRTGKTLSIAWIGPETSFTNGNIWGYDEESMKKTRIEAQKLPIINKKL